MYKDMVSVIMPSFNSEKYLMSSIRSVLNQDYSNFELIIIDDCSEDCTYTIACRFAELDNRIRVYRSDSNGGAGVTRNIGLRVAEGKYVAFLDSDDLWLPNKLSKQISIMKNKDIAISHTSYSMIDEFGGLMTGGVMASDFVDLRSYMKNTEIGLSTSIIDRSKTGPFEFDKARTRQDTRLWLRFFEQGFISNGLNDVLVKYRIRAGQISKNKLKMLFITFRVYWSVKSMSVLERISLFVFYAFNGVLKRLNRV